MLFSHFRYLALVFLFVITGTTVAQNETMNWCFGLNAGLSFTSNPPTSFTNSSMNTLEGCASISSATGGLLFYTDGVSIWNRTHALMANGSGLTGNSSSTQSGVIVKQPGSASVYYVFSVPAAGTGNLAYSVVDMALAAGLGSVTTKNTVLFSGPTEKLAATKHCNGVDIWILGHEQNSNVFRAYLLGPTGLSSTAISSSVGPSYSGFNYAGYLKFSPTGKKIAVAVYANDLELYDFDNTSGQVSNPLTVNTYTSMYGCEFSPDGSKLYAASWFATSPGVIYQYDLCAGTASAVVASEMLVGSSAPLKGALQLAPNGKIYVARQGQTELGVINNPNLPGMACNYVDQGPSIAPRTCVYGLPNFMTSDLEPPPTPFTYTISNTLGCKTASFNSSYNPTISTLACASIGYSITNLLWDFGDPASGAANSSTLQSPVHAFSNLGTYSVQLILYYSCGGGTDTLKQLVNISCTTIGSTSISCASLGSATAQANTGTGPFSYTWMPTGQTSSVATGLSPGAYTLTVLDLSSNLSYTTQVVFTSAVPFTGSVHVTDQVNCNGAMTGTGSITNLSGGSGQQSYLWTNGNLTYTTANVSSLSAGTWTIQSSDALTACHFEQVSTISEPTVISMTLSSNTSSACAGKSIQVSSTVTGGTPAKRGNAYSYSWTGGATTASASVTQNQAGTVVFNLVCRDSLNCPASASLELEFVPVPVFSVSATRLRGCVPFSSSFSLAGTPSNSILTVWKAEGKTLGVNSFSYSFSQPGNYVFSGNLTNLLNSCENTGSFVVNAFAPAKADFRFTPETPVEGLEIVSFTNTSTGENLTKFHWYFLNNSGLESTEKNSSYFFSEAGNYPVALVVEDEFGCVDTIVKAIRVLADFQFFMPNVFTPNDDGKNEFFLPAVRGVKFYELRIFDRWGKKLFFTNDPVEGWDGTFNGEACKEDFYIWKIKLSTTTGEEKTYAGNFSLIR